MPKLFPPLAGGITYVKTYSTFRNNTTDHCLALVLLPSSQHRRLVSLQSIQFDFDIQGHVPGITIFYQGTEEAIQKQAEKTRNELIKLEGVFGITECSLFMFSKKDSCLKIALLPSENGAAYFLKVYELLKAAYLMQEDFAEKLKSQLLNKDYLAKEFARLGGRRVFCDEVVKQVTCSIS